jgi:hypothetical protein
MTDPALDGWLAAHYGMNPDNVPAQKPEKMSRYIHGRLKKQFFGPNGHGAVRQAQKGKSPSGELDDSGVSDNLDIKKQMTSYQGNRYEYQVVPSPSYKHSYYESDAKNVKTILDVATEKDNELKLLQLKCCSTTGKRRKNSGSSNGS